MRNRYLALPLCFVALAPLTETAAAQTPRLKADAEKVVHTLKALGITNSEGLFDALRTAWDSDRTEEYARLRALGIALSDEEFDAAVQNRPDRPDFHDPYDLELWVGDVMRSWGRVHPRDAFTWLYSTRHGFDYSLGAWQTFVRVTKDWARAGREEAVEAEQQALSLDDGRLRQDAIAGVIEGNILRGDVSRMDELMSEVTDDSVRRQLENLYAKYFG